MAQYAYFASQHATAASWTAKLASANARAASSGRSASPYSNTFRLVCSFQRCQARRPPAPHSQNQAWPVIAGVRCIALSSASSAFLSAESCANGGAGRRASPEAMSQVLQPPARGRMGLVPVQEPGVTGTEPVHFVSKRSAFPRSTALSPTARPSARPAATSLGKPTAAMLRERPASSAMARNTSAFSGNREASTSEAAPAAAACSDGYDGLDGTGREVLSSASQSFGRARL